MAFFLGSIEKDAGCASKVILDGVPMSPATLQNARTKAQVEIFPCQHQCCSKDICKGTHLIHPLRLYIVLSAPCCFSFSLYVGDEMLLSRKDFLLVSCSSWLSQQYPMSCVVSFKSKGALSLNVVLSAVCGASQRVCLKPGCSYEEPNAQASILPCRVEPINKRCVTCEHCPLRSHQCSRIFEELRNVSPSNSRSLSVSFDDCESSKRGLTGAYQWKGLKRTQTISVCKLKFWMSADFISGFQASYKVDGLQELGPRRESGVLCHLHFRKCFEMREGENIGCIQIFRHAAGFIRHLFIVTDKGRSLSTGINPQLIDTKPKTLLRHPRVRLVGFRGSFEDGRLIELGFVHGLSESNQVNLSESFVCYVCGALSAYFRDIKVFEEHVSECVLHLVSSTQSCAMYPGTAAQLA